MNFNCLILFKKAFFTFILFSTLYSFFFWFGRPSLFCPKPWIVRHMLVEGVSLMQSQRKSWVLTLLETSLYKDATRGLPCSKNGILLQRRLQIGIENDEWCHSLSKSLTNTGDLYWKISGWHHIKLQDGGWNY